MRLRILGAVELWDGSAWVSVRATRQRQLLAILLVHRGRVVDAGWLIEQLWDGRPPASASQLLPHYVWRLRRLLPDGACQLRTSPVGYALDVRTDDLDVEQFASLVDDGRGAAANGAYDRAISSLSSGLALWRGPALADARSLPALEAPAHRLDQQRLDAQEALAAALVAAGRHQEALPALEELTAEEPLRERPWRLLMLALHRAGHRAEALDAYQRLQHALTRQQGIEPSRELRELHRRMLADDPLLVDTGSAAGEAGGTGHAVPEDGGADAVEPQSRASSFGSLLRDWRDRAHLTQEQLAELAGMGPRTVRRLESDRVRRPRADSIRLLAKALGLSQPERAALAAALRAGRRPRQASAAVPRQLPADVIGFIGRVDHLRRLDAQLGEGRAAAVVISAIAGSAGVGKTAMAVHWAHRVAGRFPDGQLYVNLHGYSPQPPTSPVQALSLLLRGLGVDGSSIPVDEDAAGGLYRSLLADRRALVLLDNARDAAQVRPLLPGAGGSLVVVTSRDRLTGLAASHGVDQLALDVFTPGEARELLVRRLGPERVANEPDAVDEIIARCDRLPLALAIVAARAADHAGPLAGLAAELRGAAGGLDSFAGGDLATDLRAVFSWSYEALPPDAARLFRLLGLHAGPDIAAPAVASLAATSIQQARLLLAELTNAHLLVEHAPGRFTAHDLLRAYAGELAELVDPDDERRAARHRALDHYLHSAHAADRLLDVGRDPIELEPPRPGVHPERSADTPQALAWLTAEHPVLVAAVRRAAEDGFDAHAWRLAWVLAPFFDWRGHWHDQAAVQSIALDAARRLGDRGGQARAHRALGGARSRLGREDEAYAHFRSALELYGQVGDRTGQAHCDLMLAWVLELRQRYDEALKHACRALAWYEAVGSRRGQAKALNAAGWYHSLLGHDAEAVTHCRRALALHRETGNRHAEASAWDSLGLAHHNAGDHGEAAACYRRALDVFREFGDPYNEADVLTHLGDTHHAAGDHRAAGDAWQAALAILERLRHPSADRLRSRLHSLDA